MQDNLKHSDKYGAAITMPVVRDQAEPLHTGLVTEGHQTVRRLRFQVQLLPTECGDVETAPELTDFRSVNTAP